MADPCTAGACILGRPGPQRHLACSKVEKGGKMGQPLSSLQIDKGTGLLSTYFVEYFSLCFVLSWNFDVTPVASA